MQRLALALVTLGLLGCNDTTTDLAKDDDPRQASAPVLDDAHLGWKAQNCESCHEVPVVNHIETKSADCASCHGGNGACAADAATVARVHDMGDDCVSCHQEKHGFVAQTECTNCHYADRGTVACDSGPITPGSGGLSGNLMPGCYNLGDAANEAPVPVRTALQAGEAAVDFTLKDRDGNSFALSTLLESKPVALVFGAYT